MKNKLAFVGLVLILISSNIYLYEHGRIDGKRNYQRSRNFQLTLDSQYNFGVMDGEESGYYKGYNRGAEDCKAQFLKLSHKQKRKYCR